MSIAQHFRGKRLILIIALLLIVVGAALAALPSRFNILNLFGLIKRPGHAELRNKLTLLNSLYLTRGGWPSHIYFNYGTANKEQPETYESSLV